MAKIAGRKNEAAWQAANNWMAAADPQVVAALEMDIEADPTVAAAYNAIVGAYGTVGIPLPDPLQSLTAWVSWMTATGFPWEVWVGIAAYDFYTKIVGPDGVQYKRQITPFLEKAAHYIRQFVKLYQFGARGAKWLAGDTHPTPSQAAVKAARKADPKGWVTQRRAALDAAREKIVAARANRPPVAQLPAPKKKELTGAK